MTRFCRWCKKFFEYKGTTADAPPHGCEPEKTGVEAAHVVHLSPETIRIPTAGIHCCHARGCRVSTKPEMLMCFRHWKMVPRDIQRWVWRTYRPGQCDDKRPSKEWHAAADAAIAAVFRAEQLSKTRVS
jgi:hypothetical protein